QKERKLFQEAEDWFFGKESDQLFSFDYICAILGLATAYIQRGLLSWKEAKLKLSSVEPEHTGRQKYSQKAHRSPPRTSRAGRATSSHTDSSKPVADRIPWPNLCRLRFGLHVEGESVWLAPSGRHLVHARHRRLLCCYCHSCGVRSEGKVVGESHTQSRSCDGG